MFEWLTDALCVCVCVPGSEVFLGVVDSAIAVGSTARADNTYRVASVSFHCLTSNRFDLESIIGGSHPNLPNPSSEEGSAAYVEHPCLSITRILTNGNFYFSSTVDLSSRLESRLKRGQDDDTRRSTHLLLPVT